jgi:mannosylglucosylglycerate synthase
MCSFLDDIIQKYVVRIPSMALIETAIDGQKSTSDLSQQRDSVEILNIADLHFKSHKLDGVSLMMEEVRRALEGAGYNVHTVSGNLPDGIPGLRIPELSYQEGTADEIRRGIFNKPKPETQQEILEQSRLQTKLIEKLYETKRIIFDELKRYILENKIDVLMVRNVFSLPLNLPAALAIYDLANDPDLPNLKLVGIHHDFYTESPRIEQYTTHFTEFLEIIKNLFPPMDIRMVHAVINSAMVKMMEENYGADAILLTDMYDFPELEEENDEEVIPETKEELTHPTLREQLGLDENDLMIVMATRVVPRKSIEFAINYVHMLSKPEYREQLEQIGADKGFGLNKIKFGPDSKIVLILPQSEDLKDSWEYAEVLKDLAKSLNVEIRFAGEFVRPPDSEPTVDGDERVSFSQVYQESDLDLYTTIWEGFGNQLLEIIKAGKMPVLFKYPVFIEDIEPYLTHFVALEGEYLQTEDGFGPNKNIRLNVLPEEAYQKAVEATLKIFADPDKLKKFTVENYKSIGSRFSSKAVIERFVKDLKNRLAKLENS